MSEFLTTKIPTVLKYTSKVCSPLLKWYYTEQRLQKFLLFDISASGEPLLYNFHSQEGTCYLAVTNLSPFDFTVDRIKVDVVLNGGGSFSCTSQIPNLVKGASREMIYLRSGSPMTDRVFQHAKEAKRARVEIETYIVTNIRSFRIHRYLDDIKNVCVNG